MPQIVALADWKKEKDSTFVPAEWRLQLGAYWGATHLWDKGEQVMSTKPQTEYAFIFHVGVGGVHAKLTMTKLELHAAFYAFQHFLEGYRYLKTHDFIKDEERYKIQGVSYVSVTQVLKYSVGKPGLLGWYAKMAREGKDPNQVRDEAAEIGRKIHRMVEFYLKGKAVDLTQAPEWMATTSVKFSAWTTKYTVDPVCVEQVVVHPELGYAGTLDAIVKMDERILTKEG